MRLTDQPGDLPDTVQKQPGDWLFHATRYWQYERNRGKPEMAGSSTVFEKETVS